MANITGVRKQAVRGDSYLWETITNGDTPLGVEIYGGRYTFSVVGEPDGMSVELQYSPDNTNFVSIDSTNLTFTAEGLYNLEIGAGFVKPVATGGGGSTDLDCYLSPILLDE